MYGSLPASSHLQGFSVSSHWPTIIYPATLYHTRNTKLSQKFSASPFCRMILPSHMPSKRYHEDITQTLMLSKPHSIKLIEDVPFQNMPMLHPDEEVSEENEFGPLWMMTSALPQRFTYQTNLGLEPKSTLLSELISIHLKTSRLKSDQGEF